MHIINHLAIGTACAVAINLDSSAMILFIAASVIMDVDHAIEIKTPHKGIRIEHIFNIKKYKEEINYESPQRALHIFHTFEFILFLYLMSFLYDPIFWIAMASMVHLLVDAIGNIWNRNIKNIGGGDWIKYWFLSYYFKKGSIFNKENF